MAPANARPELDGAKYVLAVANDARFLFNRLRQDPFVASLAERHDPRAIVDWINRHGSGPPKGLEHEAELYAYLVALALGERRDVLPEMDRLRLPALRWAPFIAAYVLDSLRATNHAEIKGVSPQPFLREDTRSSVSYATIRLPQ